MSGRIATITLLAGLAFSLLLFASRTGVLHLPGNHQDYEPVQPIAYSHRLHAGELQIPCMYCHFGAEKSRHAGIPAAGVCMNCHRYVTAPMGAVRAEDEQAQAEKRKPRTLVSPELQKLYDALALDARMQPNPSRQTHPVAWVKVHNLPDFVYFDHRAHVSAGVQCQTCHGPVETMERVRQVPDLSMGWCVNCHRESNRTGINGRKVNASTDCSACHV
ncbi:MAG: cytochrome c3 family protein [Bryobacterales bacterium]|nr:cytochrome c3 family protein [Bryobacterales bacterium]